MERQTVNPVAILGRRMMHIIPDKKHGEKEPVVRIATTRPGQVHGKAVGQ